MARAMACAMAWPRFCIHPFFFAPNFRHCHSLGRTNRRSTPRDQNVNKPEFSSAISKFRLGNNQLRIETGRHTIPKTPINLRTCCFCHSDEIENELHFLFSCKVYDNLRLKFFNEITLKYSIFNEFDINAKSLFLCNSIDPVCRSTTAFAFQAMSLRNFIFQLIEMLRTARVGPGY